jgi:hypothetical protein
MQEWEMAKLDQPYQEHEWSKILLSVFTHSNKQFDGNGIDRSLQRMFPIFNLSGCSPFLRY